jgi:hypothetical protein
MWLSYRCLIAEGEESIPLFGPYELIAQIGSAEYARPRRFRQNLEKWLDMVRLVWPAYPACINADRQSLQIARAVAVLPAPDSVEQKPNSKKSLTSFRVGNA